MERAGRFLFVDCGGYDGCSVVKFLLHRPGFECISFEPNPELAGYYRWLPTQLIRKAVSTHDGTVQFRIDPLDADGSSIHAGKEVVYRSEVPNEECPTVEVECIDLSGFLAKNVEPDDYLCLKIDVEGAEYEILDKMIREGTIEKVKELYAEFHWHKCGIPREEHDRLVERLRPYGILADWDPVSHRVHTLGFSRKLRRALAIARIWALRPFARPEASAARPFPGVVGSARSAGDDHAAA